jgi:cytoskeletal protein CcmA (bactofilin family)
MLSEKNPESFIDQNTAAKGTLKTEGRVCIDGLLEGQVIAQDRVRITRIGRMRGEMQTREALIEGTVRGPVEASEKVILTETSDVESDVVSPCLNVQPGACLKGHFIIMPDSEERNRLKKEQRSVNSKTLKPVSLSVAFSEANNVRLIGDFCDWNEKKALSMKLSNNGNWTAEIQLRPGTYEYLFLVDGQPQPDPANPQRSPNSYGGENSILTVS